MKKIILMLGIPIALCSCSGSKNNQPPQSDSPPSPSMPASPASGSTQKVQRAPDDTVISKKDTGRTDKIIFLVKNTSEPSIDRSSYSVTKPENDEKYIAVQIWIKNVSNEEVKIFEDDIKLTDQNDAEFAEKNSFTEHRKNPILFNEKPEGVTLKPNQSKSGWVTFTTDKKSKAIKITYLNVTVKL